MKLPTFKEIVQENDIVQQALHGEGIDSELYEWLGCDILKLSYIKNSLKQGMSIEKVADFYGVTVEGIKKFILKEE